MRANRVSPDPSATMITESYRRLAILGFDQMKNRGEAGYYALYGTFFASRQHLELALKDLIWASRLLLDEEPKVSHSHDLNNLWSLARGYLVQIWSGDARDELDQIEQIILWWHLLDPTGALFRFADTDLGVIDIRSFEHDFDAILDSLLQSSEFLSCCYMGVVMQMEDYDS